MWIECQKLLTMLKEYEAKTLEWIQEHGISRIDGKIRK